MATYQDQYGKPISAGKLLGAGGEASVFLVNGDPNSVLKIYIPQKRSYYEPRLTEMIAHPPEDQTRKMNPPHISIAWAERMVFENKKFVGYTMPIIKKAPDIFEVYSPLTRHKNFPNFNWGLLHHTALNLAIAVNAYHAAGYVIGDLNSKNVKVHENAMVTMIDTDSVQVKAAGGKVLRCPVGVAEFTSPELQGIPLDSIDRDIYHDSFALGVMIFLLLMEGYHPFTGVPTNSSISLNKPAFQYCIEKGIYPFYNNGSFAPPKTAPSYDILHPDIQLLFNRCFSNTSLSTRTNRPLPAEWFKTLDKVEKELKPCNNHHVYYPGYGKCPWCEREKIIASINIPIQKPAPQFVTPPQSRPAYPVIPPSQSRPARPAIPPSQYRPQPVQKKSKAVWGIIGCVVVLGVIITIILSSSPKNLSNGYSSSSVGSFLSDLVTKTQDNDSGAASTTEPAASCYNAPALTLSIGDMAKVITGTTLRGHSEPSLSSDNVVARYQFGDKLKIIDGPVCAQSSSGTYYWMWQVEDGNDILSWVAEGDQSQYYLIKK